MASQHSKRDDATPQESMRMRPVAAGGAFRVVGRDVRLSNGLVLPRGATITGSNLSLLNSPLVWDQPERFMPVRRADGTSGELWLYGPAGPPACAPSRVLLACKFFPLPQRWSEWSA